MNLNNDTLKKFADLLNVGKSDKTSKTYGTIKIDNGTCTVLVDGSSMPISVSNDNGYDNGDRVEVNVTDKNLAVVTPVTLGLSGGKMVMMGGGGTTNIVNNSTGGLTRDDVHDAIVQFIDENPDIFDFSSLTTVENANYLKVPDLNVKFYMARVGNTNEFELRVNGQSGSAKIAHADRADISTDSTNSKWLEVDVNGTYTDNNRIKAVYENGAIWLTHSAQSIKNICVDYATTAGSTAHSDASNMIDVKINGAYSENSHITAELINNKIRLANSAQHVVDVCVDYADEADVANSSMYSNLMNVKMNGSYSENSHIVAELINSKIWLVNSAQSSADVCVDYAEEAGSVDWSNVTNAPTIVDQYIPDWNTLKSKLDSYEIPNATHAGSANSATNATNATNATYSNNLEVKNNSGAYTGNSHIYAQTSEGKVRLYNSAQSVADIAVDYADEAATSEDSHHLVVNINDAYNVNNRLEAVYDSTTGKVWLEHKAQSIKDIAVDYATKSVSAENLTNGTAVLNLAWDSTNSRIKLTGKNSGTAKALYLDGTAHYAAEVPWSGVTNKPNFATKTSDLTNDSGFITASDQYLPDWNTLKGKLDTYEIPNATHAGTAGSATNATNATNATYSNNLEVKNSSGVYTGNSHVCAEMEDGKVKLYNSAQASADIAVDYADKAGSTSELTNGTATFTATWDSTNSRIKLTGKNSGIAKALYLDGTAHYAAEVPWSGVTNKPNFATKTSDLTNDSGFITASDQYLPDWNTLKGKLDSYEIPNATHAGTANSATSATTATGLKNSTATLDIAWDSTNSRIKLTGKNSGTAKALYLDGTAHYAAEVPWSGVSNKPTIPTKTSELTNDSGFLTSVGTISYNSLSNKPTIPTNTNQLTNGAGFITSSGSCASATNIANGTATVTATWDSTNSRIKLTGTNSGTAKALYLDGTAHYASEVPWSGVSNKPTIPSKTSQLTNDSDFITSSDYRLTNARAAAGGTSEYSQRMETWYTDGSKTYGSNYPIFAQWRDSTHVRWKCTNYTTECDYAENAANATNATNVPIENVLSASSTTNSANVGLTVGEGSASYNGGIHHEYTSGNLLIWQGVSGGMLFNVGTNYTSTTARNVSRNTMVSNGTLAMEIAHDKTTTFYGNVVNKGVWGTVVDGSSISVAGYNGGSDYNAFSSKNMGAIFESGHTYLVVATTTSGEMEPNAWIVNAGASAILSVPMTQSPVFTDRAYCNYLYFAWSSTSVVCWATYKNKSSSTITLKPRLIIQRLA